MYFYKISSFNFSNWIFLKERKVQNDTIRAAMEVGKNMFEVTKEKKLWWFGHVNRMPQNRLSWKNLEWKPEGDPTKEGWME
jgi:hypothetical protein